MVLCTITEKQRSQVQRMTFVRISGVPPRLPLLSAICHLRPKIMGLITGKMPKAETGLVRSSDPTVCWLGLFPIIQPTGLEF
jgi:hypothetical protein